MTQVAIVGGGPVGLGLAIDLGQRGINVVVIEQTSDLHNIPKGQNLTQRTAEHFRAWGVREEVEAARAIPGSFGESGVTTYRTFDSDYSYEWLRRADVSEFYSESNLRIPQYDLERVLRARAAQLETIDVRYSEKVVSLVTDGDLPEITVQKKSGKTYSITAEYVVGCDGARSDVREAVGLKQSLRSNYRRMILSVFRSEQLDDILSRFPNMTYFNALHPDFEGYWQFLGRVDMKTWFFHAPVPEDVDENTVDLASRLAAAVGQDIEFELEYLGFWNLRIAIADEYRAGRVFIAGDAAHSHPPYGGYGVNNGFEDARNLSWKLEAALKGWGSDALLDSYTAERQPVFSSTADDFIARMIEDDRIFLENFDPDTDKDAFEAEWRRRSVATKGDVGGYYPNYQGSPIIEGSEGAPSAMGNHEHAARSGCYLTPKDDVMSRLGSHFSLVTVGDVNGVAEKFTKAAEAAGVPLTVVPMEETDETLKWKARQILVRPDRFVAYVGDDAEVDAAAVLNWVIAA